MLIPVLGTLAGIVLLLGGGAAMVDGAAGIATRHGVPKMIIGLTVIAFGTSTPELVVNVLGALEGESELAFGNVFGSNIANLGLVLGAAALMSPLTIEGRLVRREVPLLLLATTIITVMALDGMLRGLPAGLDRADSIILFLVFLVFGYLAVTDILRSKDAHDPVLTSAETPPLLHIVPTYAWQWILVVVGIGALYAGGELTVRNGSALAADLGISSAIIGLFVVAVGTSMPELVTSIIAAFRGESDLAVGNVVGSNIFNSLIVLPASGVIGTIAIPPGGIGDILVSWLFAALLIPVFFLGNARFTRGFGVLFLLGYLAYLVYRTGLVSA